ncbi:MAG: S-layer homology domain-containing protein [Oscillospiraceae bacterium]|nr:S-layer homology domain-containing protein [Oscillospiraceae bacterium]
MKKSLTAAALFLTLCLCLTAALASGGDAGDPLVSLSYLMGTFSHDLENSINTRLNAADKEVRDTLQKTLDGLASGTGSRPSGSAGGNTTLKEGDVLSGATGLAFTPLGGSVSVSGGAVVDVTQGCEVSSGLLERGHRYIVAENAAAAFSVDSPAAVVSWQGYGVLVPSARPDCYAISSALRALDLFRGTGSGVGDGFDLYRAPSRGEGLVMFIRILGEEAEALACTYGHPFTDVPAWLDRYVAWAYQRGYANGVSYTEFGPELVISAVEYEEFMLRALGYSVAGVDDYSTSLERALDCGALTNGEYEMLKEASFCRGHVAYISYYTLDMTISGTRQTLAQRLTAKEIFTKKQLAAARAQVETLRLT